MSTIQTFETLFDDRVRDVVGRFTVSQKHRAIGQAVKRYAIARPLVGVQDYAGDGTTYDLSLPTGWVLELSTIQSIEYPAGERVPVYLPTEDYDLYRTASTTKIRLFSTTPATGKTARITFTKPHTVDTASSTVPAIDEEAVADLAAAIGLRDLAALFSGTTEPTLQADAIDYKSKAREYADRAKDLEARYRAHLGLDKDAQTGAASTFADTDQDASWRSDKLTHPNRTR